MTLQRSDTQKSSLFEDARKAFLDCIEVAKRKTKDEHDKRTEEEFYLSSAPGHAVETRKDVVEHLYKVSVWASDTDNVSPEQYERMQDEAAANFWESVKPRAQLLTILMKLESVKAHSTLWTDFVADGGSLKGLRDSDLPLSKQALRNHIQPYEGGQRFQCASLVDDFISRQLRVCAVRFLEPLRLYPEAYYEDRSAYFDKGDHLPLLQKEFVNKGSSAKVYRVKFACEHFPAKGTGQLAMKQFSGDNAGTRYVDEWKQSTKLHGNDHQHVALLAACAALRLEHGGLLFFPLADFDLWQYMNSEPAQEPPDRDQKLLWLQQLSRIADALSFLHQRGILHGDVKSDNTLVSIYRTGVILRIADFGNMSSDLQRSTSHALAVSDMLSPKRKSIGDECHNRAPESFGQRPSSEFPSESDVWGFGTVLSEVLAWFSLGQKSLKSFEDARFEAGNDQYFSRRHNSRFKLLKDNRPTFELRPSVTSWFDSLTEFESKSSKTGQLHLDVWSLVKRVMDCDYNSRIKIEQVREELMRISTDKPGNEANTDRRPLSSWLHRSSASTNRTPDRSMSMYEKLHDGERDGKRDENIHLVRTAKLDELSKCLNHAIKSCNFSVIDLLLIRFDTGANVIHRAIESGSVDFIKQLAANETKRNDPRLSRDLNQPDSRGIYPIIKAIKMPKQIADSTLIRLPLVEHLLDMGANVNVSDSQDETPLHYASRLALCDIVEMLITRKADVNAKDKGGVTPLHLCASVTSSDIDRNFEGCVQKLLQYEANKHAKDSANRYPLNHALDGKQVIERERWAVVRLLCQGTRRHQYVRDIFGKLPKHIKQNCLAMWHECNPDVEEI
jgi:ankyrin repeat protein